MLDSHVLLWWLSDNPTLCEHARGLIADTNNYVAASAVSVWEFRIKSARGKLSAPDTLEEATRRSGFAVLPITFHRTGDLTIQNAGLWSGSHQLDAILAQRPIPAHQRQVARKSLRDEHPVEGIAVMSRQRTGCAGI